MLLPCVGSVDGNKLWPCHHVIMLHQMEKDGPWILEDACVFDLIWVFFCMCVAYYVTILLTYIASNQNMPSN